MCSEDILMATGKSCEISVIFFLRETFEFHFESLMRDIKKSFVSPFHLLKIEIFNSNHQRMMIGRVHHTVKDQSAFTKSRSALFSTEFGAELYSKTLKGTFKVFNDLVCLTKVKELINY